jgi:hypothetical protein
MMVITCLPSPSFAHNPLGNTLRTSPHSTVLFPSRPRDMPANWLRRPACNWPIFMHVAYGWCYIYRLENTSTETINHFVPLSTLYNLYTSHNLKLSHFNYDIWIPSFTAYTVNIHCHVYSHYVQQFQIIYILYVYILRIDYMHVILGIHPVIRTGSLHFLVPSGVMAGTRLENMTTIQANVLYILCTSIQT